jgi:hypothetical protein
MFRSRFGARPDFFIVSINLFESARNDPDLEYLLRRMVNHQGPQRYEMCGYPLALLLERNDIVIPVKLGLLDSDFNLEHFNAESKVAPS